MLKQSFLYFIVTSILLFSACAVHTNLEPAGKNKVNLYLSFGGPTIKVFGLTKPLFPLPHILPGATYGVTDNLNIDGNLNILPLPYGLANLEIGATWFPLIGNGKTPTIGMELRLLAMLSFKSNIPDRFRAYPMLSPSLSWKIGKHRLYAGSNLVLPISQPDFDNAANAFIFSPFIGLRWALGEKINLLTELKWQGANIAADKLPISYASVAIYGGLSPLLGLEWRL